MPSIETIKASDGSGNANVATIQTTRSAGASTIIVDTVLGINTTSYAGTMGTPHTFTDPITSETITVISEATAVDFIGHVDGANLEIDTIAPGYTDAGSAVGDIVVIRPTSQWADNLAAVLGAGALNDDGTPKTIIVNPTGMIAPYVGRTAPTDWLMCDGSAISRATYATLFNIIAPSLGAFTITVAAPAVVTLTAHGLSTGSAIYLTTTGALPTGLSVNTLYYAIKIDANTFNLATSRANAHAGTKITTTGTQSGVHTAVDCPYGLGDGTTTFNVPDLRGRVPAGTDAMGGTAASRLTLAQTQGSYGERGATGGEQGHQIVTAELASHNHNAGGGTLISAVTAGLTSGGSNYAMISGTPAISSTGSDTAHNNVQPTLVLNYIIKV